jgi:diacylglycerol O-acyltransferase/trehalose O-mycolyltransferase
MSKPAPLKRSWESVIGCWELASAVWRRGALWLTVAAVIVSGCGSREPATREPTTRVPRISSDGVKVRQTGPRQLDLSIASEAIGHDVSVRILLPARYERDPERRWPVLYLLHGCCDSYDSWTRSTDVEALSERNDVLVVMPDGDLAGFYSDWLRGPQWERFHLQELRAVLERDFRAGDQRAVAGLSMGGLGAMVYAARRPRLFRAAAAFSGLLHVRLTRADIDAVQWLVDNQGEEPQRLWGDPDKDARRWAAHNPYDLAPKLRDLPLFVSSGNGNAGPLEPPETPPDQIEPNVLRQSHAFVARLRELGIPVRADFYGNGTHSWPYWQRSLHRSWPMLMNAIGA